MFHIAQLSSCYNTQTRVYPHDIQRNQSATIAVDAEVILPIVRHVEPINIILIISRALFFVVAIESRSGLEIVSRVTHTHTHTHSPTQVCAELRIKFSAVIVAARRRCFIAICKAFVLSDPFFSLLPRVSSFIISVALFLEAFASCENSLTPRLLPVFSMYTPNKSAVVTASTINRAFAAS